MITRMKKGSRRQGAGRPYPAVGLSVPLWICGVRGMTAGGPEAQLSTDPPITSIQHRNLACLTTCHLYLFKHVLQLVYRYVSLSKRYVGLVVLTFLTESLPLFYCQVPQDELRHTAQFPS